MKIYRSDDIPFGRHFCIGSGILVILQTDLVVVGKGFDNSTIRFYLLQGDELPAGSFLYKKEFVLLTPKFGKQSWIKKQPFKFWDGKHYITFNSC